MWAPWGEAARNCEDYLETFCILLNLVLVMTCLVPDLLDTQPLATVPTAAGDRTTQTSEKFLSVASIL